jgi:hypothetical protein
MTRAVFGVTPLRYGASSGAFAKYGLDVLYQIGLVQSKAQQ